MRKKYIEYYPPILQDVDEFIKLGDVMDYLLSEFKDKKEELRQELFIMSAEDTGLARWEEILGITEPDNDTDVRRLNILAKLLGDKSTLTQKLDLLIGEGRYKLNIDSVNCHLTINLELSVQSLKDAVNEMFEKVLPLNLTYEINYYYNKHSDLVGYTHEYLANYTHKEISSKNLEG